MDISILAPLTNFITENWYIVLAILVLMIVSRSSESTTISPSQANDLVFSKNGVILDLRSREDYSSKHIPGSHNLTIKGFEDYVISSKKTVITIHDKNADSKDTHKLFKSLKSNKKIKYNINYYFLEDGIGAWEKKNYPLNINNKQQKKK
jgi:rhodanese-related sulfurtransferase